MNNPRTDELAGRRGRGVAVFPLAPRRPSPGAACGIPRTTTSIGPAVNHEALFLAQLPVIEDVVAQVCRRHRLSAPEAEDFASEVKLRFVESRYEILRRFQGRSSLHTYLSVVIQRLFLDYRIRLWGKWRPSANAVRLGPLAVSLERLMSRDGCSFDHAVETLRAGGATESGDELYALHLKLAPRAPSRRVVGEDQAEGVAASGPSADSSVLRAEQEFFSRRVRTALDRARQAMPSETQLILKMRFEDAMPVSTIAAALHLDQKRLYRTIEQLLTSLRESLEAEGISGDDVKALLAEAGLSDEPARDARDDENEPERVHRRNLRGTRG